MAVQISTPGAEPLYRYQMEADDVRIPRSLQACIRHSEYCTLIRHSFKKIKFYHSCNQDSAIRVAVSLNAELSRKAEVMVAELPNHIAGNLDTL